MFFCFFCPACSGGKTSADLLPACDSNTFLTCITPGHTLFWRPGPFVCVDTCPCDVILIPHVTRPRRAARKKRKRKTAPRLCCSKGGVVLVIFTTRSLNREQEMKRGFARLSPNVIHAEGREGGGGRRGGQFEKETGH